MNSSIQTKKAPKVVAAPRRTVWMVTLTLVVCAVVGVAYWGSIRTGSVLTDRFSEPLSGATTASVDVHVGDGNLTIDRLSGGEQVLASGTLQYLENQGTPKRSASTNDGQAILTLKAGSSQQPSFRLPWAACHGATEWHVQLNPSVTSDLTARSYGGNVKLNLAGMAVTRVSAETGGGNMDVVLPDNASGLDVRAGTGGGNVAVEVGSGATGSNAVIATTGAGNVVVTLPSGIAAKIHASTAVGTVTVDARFGKVDGSTYQSPDYDGAANKVEITASSGAGNVIVNTK